MPFVIARNDITNMKADAILNAANPRPVIGCGVDSGIRQKAGRSDEGNGWYLLRNIDPPYQSERSEGFRCVQKGQH